MNDQQPQQRSLFEFFDNDSRTVMNTARDEVVRTKREGLEAEHLFGAILAGNFEGVDGVLTAAELDKAALQSALDEVSGMGDAEAPPEQMPVGQAAQAAIQVALQAALQAAGQMLHGHVRPEHLVLGLIQTPDSNVDKALQKVGSSRDVLGRALMARLQVIPQNEEAKRRAAEAQREQAAQQRAGGGAGASMAGMTESAQRVVARARKVAGELRHGQVGTVHLLLALLEDEDRMTSNVFFKVGVRGEEVRAELLRTLRAEDHQAEPAAVAASTGDEA
ncbi:Clp amino terminal domain protein [Planctomycetes bacterium Pla163]|uniref:Clp amino terminal domain protein n=1 Tax=Rohdeia mirabilis TaxID=2528008 RepID=A0A518CZA3_9BACT|nr:Clp amino terminal domain protein [Planctomycetes bacterium Pla163]